MALSLEGDARLYAETRHVAARPAWIRPRGHESSPALTALMFALILVGVAVIMHAVQAYASPSARLGRVATAEAAPLEAASPVAPAPETVIADPVTPEGTVAEAQAPAPSLGAGQGARIANTDGLGVVLHAAPRTGTRTAVGLLDGVHVTVLDLTDSDWAQIRSERGQVGWIPATYLAAD